jgi:hypothetical protein
MFQKCVNLKSALDTIVTASPQDPIEVWALGGDSSICHFCCARVDVSASHAHWFCILDAEPYKLAIETPSVANEVRGGMTEFIDIGGGLGVPYKPEDKDLDLAEYAKVISAFKTKMKEYGLGNRFLLNLVKS